MPWILIVIFETITKGLLNDKTTIYRLNGVNWGGGSPKFFFNPYVIAFTLDPTFKNTSSTIFLTCTTIIGIWWSTTIVTTMIVHLEVIPSLGANYLLIVVKYILKSCVSFNNWPMATIILLSNICCPISSLTSKAIRASNIFGCSMADGNPA